MISGLAVGHRRSKTFTPDMSLPRRFAPRAMSSRRCPDLLSWISQRANMARQRHLKISCDRLTATLVTPAVCQTSTSQENKFGRSLPTSVACARHASFAFTSTAGAIFQLCRERVSLNHFFGQHVRARGREDETVQEVHDSNSAARLALDPTWTFHDYELDLIAS